MKKAAKGTPQTRDVALRRPDLQAICDFYQEAARLRDWDIKISWARARELGEGVLGVCIPVLPRKSAVIGILDPIDRFGDTASDYEIEANVAHEVAHVHMAPFNTDNESLYGIAEEHLVQSFATAMVGIRRGLFGQLKFHC